MMWWQYSVPIPGSFSSSSWGALLISTIATFFAGFAGFFVSAGSALAAPIAPPSINANAICLTDMFLLRLEAERLTRDLVHTCYEACHGCGRHHRGDGPGRRHARDAPRRR